MGIGLSELIQLLIWVAIFVLIFLAIRAIVLWYWRVNEIVDQLGQINSKLDRLIPAPVASETPVAVDFEAWLAAQNRRSKDLSADELEDYRKAYEYNRKHGASS